MISILEYMTPRGHMRKQLFSLGRVPKYATKVTKSTLPKESSDKVKVQASLSRGKIPKLRKFSSWGSKKFTTHRK